MLYIVPPQSVMIVLVRADRVGAATSLTRHCSPNVQAGFCRWRDETVRSFDETVHENYEATQTL